VKVKIYPKDQFYWRVKTFLIQEWNFILKILNLYLVINYEIREKESSNTGYFEN